MTWIEITAVEVRCDTCNLTGVDDEDARWFTSRQTARGILEDHGWTFTGHDRGTATCPGCVQTTACALVGHDWGGWIDRTYSWYIGRTRTCYRCRHMEGDPPLPDIRPETKAVL